MSSVLRVLGTSSAALVLCGGSVLFACSNANDAGVDPNPTGVQPSKSDAGDAGKPAPTATDAGTTPPVTETDAAAGGPDTSSCRPPKLNQPRAGDGVFCPYSAVDGGKDLFCAPATQHCCETPKDDAGASTCGAVGAACPVPGSIVWECEDAINCPAGNVCCSSVALEADPVCGYQRTASAFPGTTCKPSCGAGEVVICQQQSTCKTGTCSPFRALGNSLGACK